MIYDEDSQDVPPHVVGTNPALFKYSEEPMKRVVVHHLELCEACQAWAKAHETNDYMNWIWAQ